MKKIVLHRKNSLSFEVVDAADYIKIEKDGQQISKKYVTYERNQFNNLKKDDVVIRKVYGFRIENTNFYIYYHNFKHYTLISNIFYKTKNIAFLEEKKSIMRFKSKKYFVEQIFSKSMKTKMYPF